MLVIETGTITSEINTTQKGSVNSKTLVNSKFKESKKKKSFLNYEESL
jgi:hypothetical protein